MALDAYTRIDEDEKKRKKRTPTHLKAYCCFKKVNNSFPTIHTSSGYSRNSSVVY